MVKEKICKTCQQSLPLETSFYRMGKYWGTHCKECDKKRVIEDRKANPERTKRHDKKARENIKNDPIRHQAQLARKRVEKKARQERDPEGFRANEKRKRETFLAAHPGYSAAKMKASKQRNPERHAEYRERTIEKIMNDPHKKAKWYQRNYLRNALRRAKDYNEEGSAKVRYADWLQLLAAFENKCCYCDSLDNPTIEHIIPISRNGPNALWNLAPACGRCNRSKGNKNIEEFCPSRAEAIVKTALNVDNEVNTNPPEEPRQ